MRAEDTLQFMMDFYPDLFYNRQKCLDYLFCVIGTGYKWVNGELVSNDDAGYLKRWKLIKPIKKAKQTFMCEINERHNSNMERINQAMIDAGGTGVRDNKWYPLCEYSKINCIPADITPDWYELAEECKQMLRDDGIEITEGCQ